MVNIVDSFFLAFFMSLQRHDMPKENIYEKLNRICPWQGLFVSRFSLRRSLVLVLLLLYLAS
jgi:hypothetical protein